MLHFSELLLFCFCYRKEREYSENEKKNKLYIPKNNTINELSNLVQALGS